jgi:hypothetical protein
MDNRITQILGDKKSASAVNTNTFINVQFNNDERLLPPGAINKVIDVSEQFNKERQLCPYYRLSGKINPLISNPLFDLTSKDSKHNTWETFNLSLFKIDNTDGSSENLTYTQSITRHLKNVNGWYGYFNPILSGGGANTFFDMEPKRERFAFIKDETNASTKNWELTITYPYTSDTESFLVKNGLFIVDVDEVTVGGVEMVSISIPVKHNLIIGDIVRITGTTKDGDYEVKSVGKNDGSQKEYCFSIDLKLMDFNIGQNSRMIKLYDGIPSVYYFRKFKKIKTKKSNMIKNGDYEISELPFSENIFSDELYHFIFNDEPYIENLTDNLGRPLSELYLTIVKTNSNGIFTTISSGLEVPFLPIYNTGNNSNFLRKIPVIQKIHNVQNWTSQTFESIEKNITIDFNEFYGDVVEYNNITLNEVILSDVNYRFSTVNRETTSSDIVSGPRPEGYYYKAHHLIKIRNFSGYIEEGTEDTLNKPSYATNLGDGRYLWRDLLEIGNTDAQVGVVNYPFLNGKHYIYQNYIFEVKRQDPFDKWDMYYSIFPADPIGNTTNNNFKVNISNNVC